MKRNLSVSGLGDDSISFIWFYRNEILRVALQEIWETFCLSSEGENSDCVKAGWRLEKDIGKKVKLGVYWDWLAKMEVSQHQKLKRKSKVQVSLVEEIEEENEKFLKRKWWEENERSFLFIVWIEFFQNCHFWFFCVMSKIDKSFPLFLLQLLFVNLKKRNKSFSKKKNLFSSSFFDLSRSPFLMFSGQLKSFKWREWERKWLFFLEFLNPNGSLPFLNMIFLKQIFSFFEAKEVHSSVFFVEKYPISLGRKIKFNLKALLSK